MAFYPDRPDVTVRVRWFFVEEGSPLLPFPTVFNSKNWSDDGDIASPLGEVPSSIREWSDGAPPWIFWADRPCGQAQRFLEGQSYATREDFSPLNWGIPPCCAPSEPQPCPTLFELGLRHPNVWLTLATGIQLVYEQRINDCATLLGIILGPSFTFHFFEPENPFHISFAVGWNDRQVLVLIEGTTSWQEFISILMGVLGTPLPVGGYFANGPIWAFALTVVDHLADFSVPTDRPIVFAGHSLGGCIAQHLNALEAQLRPTRQVASITFGTPQWATAGLRDLIQERTIDLRHHLDPVPWMPPGIPYIPIPLIPGLSNLILTWTLYERASHGIVLLDGGGIMPEEPSNFPTDDLNQLLETFAAIGWAEQPFAHPLAQYILILQNAVAQLPVIPPCTIRIEEVEAMIETLDLLPDTVTFRPVTVDIYRVGVSPPSAPAVAGANGLLYANFVLRGDIGEGDVAAGHFTHVLIFTDLSIDIRDDYNEGTRGANYDTVYIPDQDGVGLVVRFVEITATGSLPTLMKRVYLDRKLPDWPQSDV
jgi:hypothetical protein